MGHRGYPAEFRRRVLDLLEAGRKVADVAPRSRRQRADGLQLAVSGPYRPRPGAGRGLDGAVGADRSEEADARTSAAIKVIAADGLAVQTGVSGAGRGSKAAHGRRINCLYTVHADHSCPGSRRGRLPRVHGASGRRCLRTQAAYRFRLGGHDDPRARRRAARRYANSPGSIMWSVRG